MYERTGPTRSSAYPAPELENGTLSAHSYRRYRANNYHMNPLLSRPP